MGVITIFSASYCHGDEVAGSLADQLGFDVVDDEKLVSLASNRFQTPPERLRHAMREAPGFLNRLTREKERCVALLRLAVTELIGPDNLVYHGFGGLLLPNTLSHVLHVCLAATHDSRLQEAEREDCSRKEAERRMEKDDLACAEWTKFLFDLGPWDKSLYDSFFPMQSMSVGQVVDTLCDYTRRPVVESTRDARSALADCHTAAEVNRALVGNGHDTDVSCEDGHVTILLRKYSMRLQRLQSQVEAIAEKVPGVRSAAARTGPRWHAPSVYAPLDVDVPSKVLLVDDEREFVHTLSERLRARSMQPAIAYDGEEALKMVEADQPDVMILDLRMPGIDGMEVLRRVKQKHPGTEVIILTGHGSDSEERLAADLGAFAYLRKPVDIEVLTNTMKQAYSKVNAAKSAD